MKKFFRIVLLLNFLLVSTGILPVAVQADPGIEPGPWAPGDGTTVFLPYVSSMPPYSIAGQVTDEQGLPLGGVILSSGEGETAITDSNGNYFLHTEKGDYSVSPFLEGIGFAPTALDVSVQTNLSNLDFMGFSGCGDLITNGDFEADTGWDLQNATLVNTRANSGNRSLELGIPNPAANASQISTAMSDIIRIPEDALNPILRVWVYTQSIHSTQTPDQQDRPEEKVFGAVEDAGDQQMIQVLDANGALFEDLLVMGGTNGQEWALVQFNLYKYTGNSIRLGFRVVNDGLENASAMYIDDAMLQTCPTIMAPEEYSQGTAAPQMPEACINQIINPGFESVGGWGIPYTAYSAGYQLKTATYPEEVYAGNWSMRTGIPVYKAYQNRFSYSDAWQTVFIPPGATSARLTLYNKMVSLEAPALGKEQPDEVNLAAVEPQFAPGETWGESQLAGDRMYILILNPYTGTILETLQAWDARNVDWRLREFDLLRFRGQSIRIQFGTYNDGDYWNRVTTMYVDEFYVTVCDGVVPPPPPPDSTCPTGYTQRLINPSFETSNGWYIPVTAYSARYSTLRANSGARSMLTGIINFWHNRYSYSDFGQPVYIPAGVTDAILRFHVFRQSNDWTGNDKQYLLVLNHWGYWIDTLLWNSSNNTSEWRTIDRDVRYLRGQSIRLHFGTYNNGWNGITSMFVDDVILCTR